MLIKILIVQRILNFRYQYTDIVITLLKVKRGDILMLNYRWPNYRVGIIGMGIFKFGCGFQSRIFYMRRKFSWHTKYVCISWGRVAASVKRRRGREGKRVMWKIADPSSNAYFIRYFTMKWKSLSFFVDVSTPADSRPSVKGVKGKGWEGGRKERRRGKFRAHN